MAQGLTKNGKKALDAVNGQYISKTGKLTDAPGGLTLNGKAWNMAGTLSWTARTTPEHGTIKKLYRTVQFVLPLLVRHLLHIVTLLFHQPMVRRGHLEVKQNKQIFIVFII
jgi:hypothetical protein